MAFASWSVVFGEQPSAAKWNILGTNDAYFNSLIQADGTAVKLIDSSGNEILRSTQVAGSVNEVTITNAATGTAPSIAASGGDTNVATVVKGKGSGRVLIQPQIYSGTFSNPGSSADTQVATFTVAAQPVACTVLIWAAAGANLGSGSPTIDNFINLKRGTSGGTLVTRSYNTKSAANAVNESRAYSIVYSENIAASTSQQYTFTNNGINVTYDYSNYLAMVVAQ